MNEWIIFKDIATLVVGSLVALVAAFSYRRNTKTRRAEFICQLHQSFFEDETYKKVRKALDTDDEDAITAFVVKESEDFTDFLNFFELVAYLQRQTTWAWTMSKRFSATIFLSSVNGQLCEATFGIDPTDSKNLTVFLLSWNTERRGEAVWQHKVCSSTARFIPIAPRKKSAASSAA